MKTSFDFVVPQKAPQAILLPAGLELLVDAVRVVLFVNCTDNPGTASKARCREGGIVRPDDPLPLLLRPVQPFLTPCSAFWLVLR